MNPARGTRLSDHWGGRDNNFNLFRLVAATMVLVSHSFALTTHTEPLRASLGMSLGEIAVDVFFVASGFLVTASLLVRRDATDFFLARGLRIFPGLWVSLIVTVLVFGFVVSSLEPIEFFAHKQTWRFLIKNALMVRDVEYSLPGVARAVNGSLWTLPVEIRMYAMLGGLWVALVWWRERRVRAVAAMCVVAALIGVCVDLGSFAATGSTSDFWRLFAKFFAGSALFVLRDRVPVTPIVLGSVLGALAIASFDPGAFGMVYRLTIPYVALYLALVPGGPIRMANRLGDYSYGMYIYAFPVQITLLHLWPKIGPLQMIAVAFPIAAAVSVCSWHLVEERSLRLKGWLHRRRRLTRTDPSHSEAAIGIEGRRALPVVGVGSDKG